ncbi:hypothetical protein [Micromonospora arborensis]|uniref:hypothetical protein n=1 Tax=Micromonospora arborensis TaxID=2116518 RepID=UPI00142E884D|nr:hypothetical protein [Micromonospora arborensis]
MAILYGLLSGGRCGPHPTRHRRLPVVRAGMVESRVDPSAVTRRSCDSQLVPGR